MWTHLIKVPLAVRAAGSTDIPALLRLQDASLSNLRVCTLTSDTGATSWSDARLDTSKLDILPNAL